MITRPRFTLIFLGAFIVSAIYAHGALPVPAPPGPPQRPLARIVSKGNLPIKVNGNEVANGGTIVTGSAVEVPDQVSAMIDFGNGNTLELVPDSKIELDYDENGNVRAKLVRGCAVVKRKTNVLSGETVIYTDKASETTNKKRRQMGFCALPNGELSSFGPAGAAATSGGVSGVDAAIIAGDIIAIILATRGSNPSPTTP